MSLSAIDACFKYDTVICHGKNVCSIASRDLKYANKALGRQKNCNRVDEVCCRKSIYFTEIESGKAFEVMKNQIV